MERTTLRVEFCLVSNSLPLERITNAIGIEPTLKWRRGDRLPRSPGGAVAGVDCWIVGSGRSNEDSLQEQVATLLDILLPRKNQILGICHTLGIVPEIDVVVESYDGARPELELSASIIACIAELGASLSIDLYVFSDAE